VQTGIFMQTEWVTRPEGAIYAKDSLSAQILGSLTSLLPDAWRVQEETTNGDAAGDRRTDMVLTIEAGNGFGRLAVEIKQSMAPREVAQIVDRLRLTRRLDIRVEYLVAAPWLSASTRAQLTAGGINYLDLTGNVNIRLQQPALYIRTDGAANDPSPRPASVLTLKGPQAGRLVRALVDFVPPYTASMIAAAAGISVSYASRQLTELDREALVERDRRGGIVARDWTGLLRARARHYSLLSTNRANAYIAATGARELYQQLSGQVPGIRAVTGSFAASQIAPVAAPSQLTIYVDNPELVADYYKLLPADSGADVVLLVPYDNEVVYDRATADPSNGLARLAISQLALDCLAGNGRLPAEGEALLEWMASNLDSWQQASPTSTRRS
jgi:DNA-binding transcriptional ArsR family regulator